MVRGACRQPGAGLAPPCQPLPHRRCTRATPPARRSRSVCWPWNKRPGRQEVGTAARTCVSGVRIRCTTCQGSPQGDPVRRGSRVAAHGYYLLVTAAAQQPADAAPVWQGFNARHENGRLACRAQSRSVCTLLRPQRLSTDIKNWPLTTPRRILTRRRASNRPVPRAGAAGRRCREGAGADAGNGLAGRRQAGARRTAGAWVHALSTPAGRTHACRWSRLPNGGVAWRRFARVSDIS
jgi:hypothetical protein